MDCGSKLSATQIHYVCVLQELLQIILLLANTDLGNTISFMSVVDLMVIKI